MTAVVITIIFMALFVVVSFKNFFIQMISLKLTLDALILLLVSTRSPAQNPFNTQSTAVVVAGMGMVIFFVLMSVAIQMFSRNEKAELRVEHE